MTVNAVWLVMLFYYYAPTGETEMEIKAKPLTDELWREYDFGGRAYRINDPQELYMREGGTTHRIVDNMGVVHCVPAPGHMGCVLRWCVRDGKPRVAF